MVFPNRSTPARNARSGRTRAHAACTLLALLASGGAAHAQWNATEEAQLLPSSTTMGSWFGSSVALSGDTVVVGARGDPTGGAAFVYVRTGTLWTEQAKLKPADAQSSDRFGFCVAIDGDQIVIGATQDRHALGASGSVLGQGSAFVFERVGSTWFERARLTAGDAQARDQFGSAVAISGDTILVGAVEDLHAAGAGGFAGEGSAYVFVGSGASWTEQAKLTAGDAAATAEFGFAVDLAGDRAVIGARLDGNAGGFDAGAIYVFDRTGSSWRSEQKLIASDGGAADHFGSAVAISNSTLLIGSPGDSAPWPERGSAYMFEWDGAAWSEHSKLIGKGTSTNDRFGFSVSVLGDLALIGSPFAFPPFGFDQAGSAYLFHRTGTVWSQKARIVPPDSAKHDFFGRAVALDGDTALVGANQQTSLSGLGKTYVYRLSSEPIIYCTAGTSDSGCQALIGASGTPSASAASGFNLLVTGVEGSKRGLFFFGVNGRQANAWGNGSSYQCVVPPVARGALLDEVGTNGNCDASYSYDLNARWTSKPWQNPGPGALVDAQFWYRDPFNPLGPRTSISDAIEFCVGL